MRIQLAVVVTVVTVAVGIATAATYAGMGDRHRGDSRVGLNLTEEQKTAIRDKVIEMRKAGASEEDLRATRRQMLEALGYNVPEGSSRDHGRAGHFGRLSEEQQAAVRDVVKQMEQKGASREEIHASVRTMLEGLGMKVPEDSGKHHGGAGFFSQLSEEQRAAVRDMVEQMKQQGASREETRASVHQMLKSFGVAAPGALGSEAPAPLKDTSSAESASWGAVKSMFR
jgi:Spy/CpxP family protein refolding chaperone